MWRHDSDIQIDFFCSFYFEGFKEILVHLEIMQLSIFDISDRGVLTSVVYTVHQSVENILANMRHIYTQR